MAIKSGNILGEVYNYRFAGSVPATITTVLTVATTVTNQDSSVLFAGGSGVISSFAENERALLATHSQNYILSRIFKPAVAGLGFSLCWFGGSTGTITSQYCRFNTTTGVLTLGYGGTDQVSSSALPFTLGSSVIELIMSYDGVTRLTTAYARVANTLDSGVIVFAQAALSNGIQGLYAGVAYHSGSVEMYEHKYRSLTSKYGDLLGLGDSNMFGLGLTVGQAYFNMLRTFSSSDIDSTSFSGSTTSSFIAQRTQIAACLAKALMIGLGTNDLNSGVTFAAYLANIDLLITDQTTRVNPGVVFLLSILPNNQSGSASVPTWNTSLQAKANGSTVFYIDINTTVNNGSNNLNAGDTLDGVHLSPAGSIKVLNVLTANSNLSKYIKN